MYRISSETGIVNFVDSLGFLESPPFHFGSFYGY